MIAAVGLKNLMRGRTAAAQICVNIQLVPERVEDSRTRRRAVPV